ncbi:hypothetical protein [Ruegeria sp. Ofav3-42]|uniref:hypothetical protein n=1 Tax=Ruegeria sp. Ofav3-42 TaxID=2917759 RepID=UPI001EF580B0|nr:hypothetical protein [Ruegeria sp. Ofav3-42]MCG7520871.1 hypothetical protein [Ruegeria sp. Ofav3-42]
MALLNDHLTAFLLNLECLDTEGRKVAIENEVIATGGTYVAPPTGDTWASHVMEIALHGVSAMGVSEEEAIRNWTKAAHRQCHGMPPLKSVVPFVPFPAPRNHAEEIANARAAAGRA